MLLTKEEYRFLMKNYKDKKQDQQKMQTKLIAKIKQRIHF